ncbi:MAG: type II toxin-antitoxin system prevent-host-death family antitoxin [Microbacteriaceae bacterium]
MTAITATDARKNLFGIIQRVNDDRAPVEVVSKHGNVIIMSKADYDALEETAYLLRNPKGAKRLLQAIEDVHAGRFELHDLVQADEE